MSKKRITLVFPKEQQWIILALEEIVRRKSRFGLPTTTSFEAVRILSSYLRGVLTDRPSDCELLAQFKKDFFKHE